MSHEALKERAQKRLATIKATGDTGLYAQHYAEDVTALLEALEDDDGLFQRLTKLSGGNFEQD